MYEGMGVEWSEHGFNKLSMVPSAFTGGLSSADVAARDIRDFTFKGIGAGDSQRVLFKPMMGMFNQNKFSHYVICQVLL